MGGINKLPPIDPIATDPGASFGETFRASRDREQLVGETSSRQQIMNDVYEPFQGYFNSTIRSMDPDFFAHGIEGSTRHADAPGSPISRETWEGIEDSNWAPDDELLGRFLSELDAAGVEYPDELKVESMAARREGMLQATREQVEDLDATIERGGLGGQLAGGLVAGLDNVETIASLPVGVSSRVGILGTAAMEGVLNAALEAGVTPGRNRALRELGLPEESILTNALFGLGVGAGLGGTLRAIPEVPSAVGAAKQKTSEVVGAMLGRDGKEILARDGIASPDPEIRGTAGQVLRDLEEETLGDTSGAVDATREHTARMQEGSDLARGLRVAPGEDRPLTTIPQRSIINGQIEEVKPGDLNVEPERFQFKSEADAQGVTPKLRGVQEWSPERAGVVMVYEALDGTRSIADGHQRVALANRIMEQDPSQDIRLAASVVREADGFTPDDVRVRAAFKNISESADGMTSTLARDAAKILRIDPDQVANLPAGPGIARATQLSQLSDDAFQLLINRVIPDNYAAMIGRMVTDPQLHLPIARLIEKTNPSNEVQAQSIIEQALQAPMEQRTEASLFGDEIITESLFAERAKVLDRAMSDLRNDRRLFKTLTEQNEQIGQVGQNRLDAATNKEMREAVEKALAVIQANAHRKGSISEALNDGAKTYKENGRLKDAAASVAEAVRREVQRNGLPGDGGRPARQGAEPQGARPEPSDPNLGFAEPAGDAAQRQVENTRINPPQEAFQGDPAKLRDLGVRVTAGATRVEIDSHPAILQALGEMDAAQPTAARAGFGSADDLANREYTVNGALIRGTEEALQAFERTADELAWRELGIDPYKVSNRKRATIILGPPAAGKSTLANEVALARKAAIVDSDEIKKTLPEYQGGVGAAAVHQESSLLAKTLEERMMQRGANLVIPKVGGKEASIQKMIQRYKKAGYSVDLVNMDVTPENAFKRMIGRFVGTGRLIPPAYVDGVGSNPSKVYRSLKQKGLADGYAEIDNNGAPGAPLPVRERQGRDPLKGSRLDLTRDGRGADAAGGISEAREPWREVDMRVTADDGSTLTIKSGQVHDVLVERLSTASRLLECLNG